MELGKKAKAGIVGITVVGATLLTITSAQAWSGSFNGNGGGAAGSINYVSVGASDGVNVDLSVIDTISDGYCARVKIIFDIPLVTDRYHYSPKACGYQTAVSWRKQLTDSSTSRGVKVHMCRVHSDNSGQSCSSELYIDFP